MNMSLDFTHKSTRAQRVGFGSAETLLVHLWLLRPLHSVKSVVAVLLGPLLVIEAATPEKLTTVFLTLVAFILASSAVYVFNDLMDADRDRQHPKKCKRPLASGLVRTRTARAMIAVLAAATLITQVRQLIA